TFAFLILSISSLLSMILCIFGMNIIWQFSGLALLSVILFFVFRNNPKISASRSEEKFGADRILDKCGFVTETIDAKSSMGNVKIEGEEWRAVSSDESVIEKGTEIRVKEINGVTLKVIRK
ncbi:MAG: NfeD family protein, partial [Armatimonadetes bacterium]|nr:NfeD family protein [Candidatus Hippobium faecium]